MKTKKQRDLLSKKRQTVGQQLAVWNQKIVEITYKLGVDPGPTDKETLRFCENERNKCFQEFIKLNESVEKQRTWASGRALWSS